jgi:hypothetical protein
LRDNQRKTVFEGPLHQLARNTWQLLLLIGLMGVALGVFVLAWPGPSLVVAGVLFGIYLVVSGDDPRLIDQGPSTRTRRLRQALLNLEGQAQFGNILRPRK